MVPRKCKNRALRLLVYANAEAGLQTFLIGFLILFGFTKIFRLQTLQVCGKESAHIVFLLVLKLEAIFE